MKGDLLIWRMILQKMLERSILITQDAIAMEAIIRKELQDVRLRIEEQTGGDDAETIRPEG